MDHSAWISHRHEWPHPAPATVSCDGEDCSLPFLQPARPSGRCHGHNMVMFLIYKNGMSFDMRRSLACLAPIAIPGSSLQTLISKISTPRQLGLADGVKISVATLFRRIVKGEGQLHRAQHQCLIVVTPVTKIHSISTSHQGVAQRSRSWHYRGCVRR